MTPNKIKNNWWISAGYILAVMFFVCISTWVILFANGYKINWQTNTLQKTGFLLVETYPTKAEVIVAGRVANRNTPVTIKRLLPGTYLTEINKDEYRPWQANLDINPGLVTEQRNTLLTLDNLISEILSETPFKLLSNSSNNKIVLVTKAEEIVLWNNSNKQEAIISDPSLIIQRLIYENKRDIANGKITKLEFGPDNKTLIVEIVGRITTYYLSLNTDTGKLKLITFGKNITNLSWLNFTEIIFLQNNKLYLQTITENKNNLLLENIIDYTIYNNLIYGVIKNEFGQNILIKINKTGQYTKEFIDIPQAEKYELIKLANDWVLITENKNIKSIWWSITKNNELIWQKFASNIVSEIIWDNRYIIYQSGNKIMLTDLKKDILKPRIVLNNQSALNLVTLQFDTLLYIENKQLKSVDLTGYNNYQLFNIESDNQLISIYSQMHQLIYINPNNNWLELITLRDKTTGFIDLNNFASRFR